MQNSDEMTIGKAHPTLFELFKLATLTVYSQKDNLSIPELFSLKINLLFPAIDIDSRSELIWTGLV